MGRIERRGNPSLLPDGKVALRAVLYTCIRKCCRVLPSGKVSYRILAFARDMPAVWYRMPLYLNSTSISLDFAAACYNGITRKGKEGKHDVVGRKQRKSSIGTRISLSRAATKAIHTASMRAITTLVKTIS